MQPKAVVFDIGNVLLTWDPLGFYTKEIGAKPAAEFFAQVPILAMNDAVDAGAPFKASIDALAQSHPAWAPEIHLWHDRWFELASPTIPEAIALRDRLRDKGIPVFALSNFGVETWDNAVKKLPFLLGFDRLYISGVLKMAKPAPEIYAHLEADCGLSGAEIFFTDDRADNITTAARRGWRTHQCESWQGLARRLVAEDFLTEAEAGL